MTVMYFGERWDAAIFDDGDVRQVPTPVGEPCLYCREEIAEADRGFIQTAFKSLAPEQLPIHRECQLRMILGGLDHVEGRCEYIGHCNELQKAAGRTDREDALAVWDWAHS